MGKEHGSIRPAENNSGRCFKVNPVIWPAMQTILMNVAVARLVPRQVTRESLLSTWRYIWSKGLLTVSSFSNLLHSFERWPPCQSRRPKGPHLGKGLRMPRLVRELASGHDETVEIKKSASARDLIWVAVKKTSVHNIKRVKMFPPTWVASTWLAIMKMLVSLNNATVVISGSH